MAQAQQSQANLEIQSLKQELLPLLEEKEKRKRQRIFYSYFPDEGPYRRELYRPHLEFFKAGRDHRERGFMAGNRTGKTSTVLFELTTHATGEYPHWWEGARYDRPISAWCSGDTSQTVRDTLQAKLVGQPGDHGTGMIPGEFIEELKPKAGGIPDALEHVYVKHKPTGKLSYVGFKSYDQKRKAFQGVEKDIIILDEEPPLDIYLECLVRTMTINGMILLSFTPLSGISEVVLSYLPEGRMPEPQENGLYTMVRE